MQWSRIKAVVIITLSAAIGATAGLSARTSTAAAATPASKEVIASGTKYLGVPYRFGAPTNITYAFDCSSFTQYIFKSNGVKLPRTSITQAKIGKKVTKGYLSTGDLIFYNTSGKGISHVGIYAGNGKMLHSSSKGVALSSINTSYWKSKYVTARRVL
ncbi:C40 family peptidase [Cohnella rhizosphaerae]|uniref:C40 family peptidase n=1 Tax=Cohnella rhizosphaerae TaxID=1457232 RepID=A0A9X4KUJ6_9BACL|nr:C40 family peptidase [Cohnella rhizosphaerae]MDG0809139.1 C40 family peptidase [Cohnella rhizosphaerae]